MNKRQFAVELEMLAKDAAQVKLTGRGRNVLEAIDEAAQRPDETAAIGEHMKKARRLCDRAGVDPFYGGALYASLLASQMRIKADQEGN